MSTFARPRKFIKRPDDSSMKKELENLRSEIKRLDLSANDITVEIERIKLDADVVERKKALQEELRNLIAQQSSFKQERSVIQTQIKNVDTQMKRKVADIQKLTSKIAFKSTSEIDARVKYLDDLVGAGDLKLAEERKLIKEMTSLRKIRKDFVEVDAQQASIDKDKEKISSLKAQLNSIGSKEVQSRFEKIQQELDAINASNKSIYDKRATLIQKRNDLRKAKDSKYEEIRALKSKFDAEFAKFKEELAEEQKRRDAELKAQQEEEKKERRKAEAERKLEEASVPAFTEEINQIHSLLAYFDPNYKKPQSSIVTSATKHSFKSETQIRKVEMPDNVIVLKKEQEPYFKGSSVKKSRKKSSKSKHLTIDPDIIVALSNLAIPLPVKLEEVGNTVETLKVTLLALADKQEDQTAKNIEKAKEEIASLELE